MSVDNPFSAMEWQAIVENEPDIPQTKAELHVLREKLLGLRPLHDEMPEARFVCATPEIARFEKGLRNPALSEAERRELRIEPAPTVSPPIKSAHFVVNYTAGQGAGKISTAVAQDASNTLEQAYQTYLGFYGIPIVPAGTQVQVYFQEGPNSTKAPAGPIALSTGAFAHAETNSLERTLICFHEAFHLLQFQAGFTADTYNIWFLEGLATWAELKFGSSQYPSITEGYKLTYFWEASHQPMLLTPKAATTKGYYITVPFFIFLENYCNDGYTTSNVITDVIKTFKANYPSPNSDSVPYQISRCAIPYLDSSYTFEKLMVTFGARMAQGLWNDTQHGSSLYPTIYDAEHRPPQPIQIPSLGLPDDFEDDLVDQGNTWSSSSTIKAGTVVIQKAVYTLQNADPTKTWQAQLQMKNLSNNYGQNNYFAVFEYAPYSNPVVYDFNITGPQTFKFGNPQNVTVYAVFSSSHEYPADYSFKASFLGS